MLNEQNKGEATTATSAVCATAAVTGATGFIGGRLVEMLAERGAEVTCLIRGNQAGMRLHQAGAYIRTIDLADAEALHATLQGIEVLFHLAYDWGDTAWNYKAMRGLINACSATGCRLVYVSSFVVYDIPNEGIVSEQSSDTPATSGYSHTKLALETELLNAVKEKKLVGTVVQPTIVYGPFSGPWIIDPADQLKYGTVVLPDPGEGICNAVYVDDVVSALLLAATCPEAVGERFLISGAPPVTWGEFYESIARAVGAKGPKYWPAEKIKRAGSKAKKILRFATNPGHVIRKAASIGPSRPLTTASLRILPHSIRHKIHEWLFAPISQWRDHVHIPTPGHCDFLQSRTAIDISKAHSHLGYTPAFTFERGMAVTGSFLRKMYSQRDASAK
jgi:nucleoside-diphosphate-sugar epimerase